MRLIAGLLLAGIAALLAGTAAAQIAGAMPCHGEGLACNIDTAIGAYAVPILALAGTVVFAVICSFRAGASGSRAVSCPCWSRWRPSR